MKAWLWLLPALLAAAQQAGEIRGTVLDAQGGEPLASVQVRLYGTEYRTVTDSQGRFAFAQAPPGEYILHVATVGYRLATREFALAPGETVEFEVVLSPDTLRQTDSVEVRAGPFEPVRSESPSELTIEGNEVKNLASVLADDPLRAVQAMPGVAANDDFNSFFSVRGAGFRRVGLYLDGVLLHMPFHTVMDENPAGSLTMFSGDVAETVSLHAGAFPARYSDRTGAILDVRTREGSRQGIFVRGTASMSNAGVLAEGPLGKRGSWLATVRKSYLQYLLRRVSEDDTLAFSFIDGQGKLSYDLTPKQNVTVSLVDGFSDLDRSDNWMDLGLNAVMLANYHTTIARVGWSYAPTGKLLFSSHGAFVREKFDNRNRLLADLARGHYGEWVWHGEGSWRWGENATLEFGGGLRRLRDGGFWNQYRLQPFIVKQLHNYAGTGLRTGGYAQQSWHAFHGRLLLTAGVRWDYHDVNQVSTVSPQAAAAVYLHPKTQLRLGWSQPAQYPDLRFFLMRIGRPSLAPERANHFIASIEQRLTERTRLRAEFYNRDDRDLLFRSLADPRLISGEVFVPPENAPIRNVVRGYARGFDVFLQRRSANRLSGWISYSYGRTGYRDGVTGSRFPSDTDQRHTVNIFGSYRIRPTINLSLRWLYGSGFPIPGYFRKEGDRYYLAETRNAVRLPAYHRLDVRVNKAFVYSGWKMTFYAEVINVYDHRNERFDELRWYRPRDGRAWLGFFRMFPILPSVGVVLEFER